LEEPVGYGSSVRYPEKQEKSVKGADSNLGDKTTLCNKFIASQLGVLDSARRIVKCLKLARDCRFLHTRVDAVTFADAMRGIVAMSDKVLRVAIESKAGELKELFQK
jgi:hypothetical protein